MKRKFLCILNPISGDGIDRDEIKDFICSNLHNIDLSVWETTGKEDIKKIKSQINQGDWDGVLVGGGDGTIKVVVEAMDGLALPIGIIPLGSANGLAACLGIHHVSDAIHAIKSGNTISMDLLKINGELSLHLSDFGFNAGMVKKFANQSERGMMAYFKSSLAQFFEMKPYRFEVILDGKKHEFEAKMLVIANGDRYGTGAIINPEGKMDDGKLEVIALNPQDWEDGVTLSIDLFSGTLNYSPIVTIWSGHELEVRNLDGADFQIDGEVMPDTDHVHVVCEANQVDFFYLNQG